MSRCLAMSAGLALVLLLLSGCSGNETSGDSGLDAPDGNPVVDGDAVTDAGRDAWRAGADEVGNISRIGTADTLEIADWNMRNFPTNATTPFRIAALIAAMDLDLVAVEEIASIDGFNELLSDLPGYQGVLSADQYSDGTYQKTGFIYRTSVITLSASSPLFAGDSDFPRPPLKATFDIALPNGHQTRLVLIDVHLKAGTTADDETRRKNAIVKLKNNIDIMLANTPGTKVVLLGDCNDSPADAAADNIFQPMLDDSSHYTVLTLSLAQAGQGTYIGSNEFLDNQVITSTAAPDYQGGSTTIVMLDQQVQAYSYRNEISDHRPVVSVFPLP